MHGDGCERQQEEEEEGVTESAAGQQVGSLLLTDGPAGWLAGGVAAPAAAPRRLPGRARAAALQLSYPPLVIDFLIAFRTV